MMRLRDNRARRRRDRGDRSSVPPLAAYQTASPEWWALRGQQTSALEGRAIPTARPQPRRGRAQVTMARGGDGHLAVKRKRPTLPREMAAATSIGDSGWSGRIRALRTVENEGHYVRDAPGPPAARALVALRFPRDSEYPLNQSLARYGTGTWRLLPQRSIGDNHAATTRRPPRSWAVVSALMAFSSNSVEVRPSTGKSAIPMLMSR